MDAERALGLGSGDKDHGVQVLGVPDVIGRKEVC